MQTSSSAPLSGVEPAPPSAEAAPVSVGFWADWPPAAGLAVALCEPPEPLGFSGVPEDELLPPVALASEGFPPVDAAEPPAGFELRPPVDGKLPPVCGLPPGVPPTPGVDSASESSPAVALRPPVPAPRPVLVPELAVGDAARAPAAPAYSQPHSHSQSQGLVLLLELPVPEAATLGRTSPDSVHPYREPVTIGSAKAETKNILWDMGSAFRVDGLPETSCSTRYLWDDALLHDYGLRLGRAHASGGAPTLGEGQQLRGASRARRTVSLMRKLQHERQTLRSPCSEHRGPSGAGNSTRSRVRFRGAAIDGCGLRALGFSSSRPTMNAMPTCCCYVCTVKSCSCEQEGVVSNCVAAHHIGAVVLPYTLLRSAGCRGAARVAMSCPTDRVGGCCVHCHRRKPLHTVATRNLSLFSILALLRSAPRRVAASATLPSDAVRSLARDPGARQRLTLLQGSLRRVA